MPDNDVLQTRKKIGEIAQHILSGEMTAVLGAQEIVRLRFYADVDEHDPDFLPFVGVDSEADSIVVPESARPLWNDAALARMDTKRQEMEAWARDLVAPSCRRLIDRFVRIE